MPEYPYQKIVSLVPSLTELLIDLGLKEQVAGRTRFCIHPDKDVKDIPVIGGTKNPRLETIIELSPDLVIANKEENNKEDIEVLNKYTEVRVTEINTIQDAILEISSLGEKLGVQAAAKKLVQKITHLLDKRVPASSKTVAYLIWKDPWMTVGHDTYIHDVLHSYHLNNVYGLQKRYPKTSLDKLSSIKPDLILLSSEPYPFSEKHLKEVQEACPGAEVQLIDGEWFSWYGSRMVQAFEQLNAWRAEI